MAGSGEGNGNGIRSRMGRVRHGLGFSARVANQISLMKLLIVHNSRKSQPMPDPSHAATDAVPVSFPAPRRAMSSAKMDFREFNFPLDKSMLKLYCIN